MIGAGPARRLRRRTTIAGAAVLAVAMLAACSSSSKTASPSTDATSTTVSSGTTLPTLPAPTGTPLKIAYMLDASGPQGPGQGDVATKVAKAWVAYANSHGGVAGHPVELTVKDTAGDPAAGQSDAAALVADKSTIAVMLTDASGESSYAKTLSDGGLPVVGGLGYYPTVWGALPNVFAIATTFPAVVNMQAAELAQVGGKKAGAAYCAEVDSCVAAGALYGAAVKKLNLTYTGGVKVSVSAPDFTAQCLQFINSNTDVIQFSASASVGARMWQDCKQQGYTGWFGASAGTVTPALYADAPEIKLTGTLDAFPWWTNNPEVKQFRDVMAAEGVSDKDFGAPAATATYASLELFKKALEGAKATLPASPTRENVIAAYGAVKNENLGGLLPQPLSFTAGKPSPLVNCFWLFKYENSKFSGGETPSCDTPS